MIKPTNTRMKRLRRRPVRVDALCRKERRRARVLKRLVLAMDNHNCRICGEYVGHSGRIDYVVPRACGGRNALDNLQTLCTSCHDVRRILSAAA